MSLYAPMDRPREGPATAQGYGASAAHAHRWVLAAFVLSILSVGVGTAWDRAWHVTRPFEDFWSPPHLFIYATHALAMLALARVALDPDLRRHFERALRLPLLGDLPPALVLAGGGLATISLAGALDAVWHTAFGLDETAWSFPHSMLGSGILLSLLGFLAARFAIVEGPRPTAWLVVVYATLLFGTIVNVLGGPTDNYRSPEHLRAVAALAPLAASDEFQRAARLHETYGLMRTGPLFLPLVALAAGVALGFARTITTSPVAFLAVALLATLLSTGQQSAGVLGLTALRDTAPTLYVIPAAIALVGPRLRLRGAWPWRVAGAAFGASVAAVWGGSLLAVALAAPLMAVGAAFGGALARQVREPDERVLRLCVAIGLALPAATGLVDLALRLRAP